MSLSSTDLHTDSAPRHWLCRLPPVPAAEPGWTVSRAVGLGRRSAARRTRAGHSRSCVASDAAPLVGKNGSLTEVAAAAAERTGASHTGQSGTGRVCRGGAGTSWGGQRALFIGQRAVHARCRGREESGKERQRERERERERA